MAGVLDSELTEFKESWLETLCCVLWQHNLLSRHSSPLWNMGNFSLCFTKLANNTGNNIKGNCLTVCLKARVICLTSSRHTCLIVLFIVE